MWMTWLPVTLSVLDMIIVYNLQQDDVTGVISKILRTPSANSLGSMYDNQENKANIGY